MAWKGHQWSPAVFHGLERLRSALGLDQLDLASALGVPQAQISRWESGQIAPSQRSAERLRELLRGEAT